MVSLSNFEGGKGMLREQKTVNSGCLCESKLETESNKEVRSIPKLKAERTDTVAGLIEKVLSRENLNNAYKRVKSNGGAAGIDGMTVEQILPYLKEHKENLQNRIRNCKYKPKAVRRVEIPKPDGGKRSLGIPTVIDRMLQQAMVQVLQPIFEADFSDSSYGFRPKRSAKQAILKAKEYYEQGYTMSVDIDLAKYFDTVNHDILMRFVEKKVKDKAVLYLIRSYLKSGVMIDGIVQATDKGTPQGGNLSPILSNIYLTEFDKELEKRGHKFVRYADDCNIYVKTKRAAERVMTSTTRYLEGKLKLKVNTEKSKVGSPKRLKFLGFSLWKIKGETGIRVHEKPLVKFKKRVIEITKRNRGRSIKQVLQELKVYTVGWINYFKVASLKSHLQRFEEWIRRRIRMYIWKQWKKISARYSNLQRLGIPKSTAWQWANTRKGHWHIANSFILSKSLTNDYLKEIGYVSITDYHKQATV